VCHEFDPQKSSNAAGNNAEEGRWCPSFWAALPTS
jgi:hypothetical protein